MSNQTFTVTGITTKDGVSKVRWTQNLKRYQSLLTKQEVEFRLINLPQPMTKLEALAYLKDHPDYQSQVDQTTIAGATQYRETVAAKATGTYVMKKRGRPRKIAVTVEQITDILKETV